MEIKDKLCLYKGILLGHSGNSLATRFKLMRIVGDNNVDDLYAGVRIDSLSDYDFESGEIIRCDWGDALIFAPERGEETVFRHCQDDEYYYDVLDANTRCILIDDDVTQTEHGCCNLRGLNDASVIERVSVKSKRKDRRN